MDWTLSKLKPSVLQKAFLVNERKSFNASYNGYIGLKLEPAFKMLKVSGKAVTSLPDLSVRGIFQAGILKWVAIFFSRGSSPPRDQIHVSCIAGWFYTTEPPAKPSNHL